MSSAIQELKPTAVWNHFAQINAIPRPSKKEERIIAFVKNFGAQLGLPTHVDEVGNIIIKKPASPGMEGRSTVVMQSHLDMVHQKNADTEFDFDQEGIRMLVDGDWVKADGTTLGADNGLGVAAIMAVLAADDIAHPPIEALFTIDEETGMTGAKGLKGGLLEGKIMLNLDTEDDDELTIGCAGGIDITATGTYKPVAVLPDSLCFELSIRGLTGGHSGMDIHLGRGNANKLMNRFLSLLDSKFDLSIHAINGGGLRNALPRESFALVAIPESEVKQLHALADEFRQTIQMEYKSTDPEMTLEVASHEMLSDTLPKSFQKLLLRSIYACPNGIYRMSPDVEGLVQTSNNLARVRVKDGAYEILCLTRSSVDSEKMDEAQAITSTFELMGANVRLDGSYPGWTPKPDSTIVQLMSNLYTELFGEEAHVMACHAGLECGILGKYYPNMEMISFGPNIRGAHSPDEKAQISSVQKFWHFLLETLKRIP